MFTINISFKDALTCYETLSHIKPDEELCSIESEFVKYAKKKAKVGDSAAKAWLQNNTFEPEEDITESGSPMSYFVEMQRPSEKDDELEELARLEAEEHRIEVLGIATEEPKEEDLPPLTKDAVRKAMQPLEEMV